MPDELIRVRDRQAADVSQCIDALATVHEGSGYPTNWPADPARWLTPSGMLRGWIAVTDDLPVAGQVIVRAVPATAAGRPAAEVSRLFVVPAARRRGVAGALLQQAMHWAAAAGLDLVLEVTDHLRPARALYERAGFRLASTYLADWTTPDGQPVTLHHYIWSAEPVAESWPAGAAG
ncbi:MAG TPA: GNAT family N-acetyltransferase [Streptosporangiaceae bacterium]|nr:GNAT family N-acetyltransferase [Streptosporangiaceae bacterium]